MTCEFIDLPGGGRAIVCHSRGKTLAKCATCGKGSKLLCDGCDRPLCGDCHVSPKRDVDFCPACARPVFATWLRAGELGHHPIPTERQPRRMAFRAWARANPSAFEQLTKRTP